MGDDSILDQILSDGVKATRKCKGKKVGINENKAGDGECAKKLVPLENKFVISIFVPM